MEKQAKMTEEAIEARRAYKREWYARNRDKARAEQARYWQRKADAKKEKNQPEAE